ncbi:acetyltransferase [Enterococcus sp. JM4C]|uniref:GNAT family N-acetyltransferase n=1 Tax=Candidatus Enterococcus huntleyi TaxID=1857217 RepID=UPI00137B6659|nr:GNAT family N-acetyltransferase [Enterococcus sp. JM4C]KAF1298150.1 acetyltransferase [Enterococcus sp. JM4C]
MEKFEWKQCTIADLSVLRSISIETFTDTFAEQNTKEALEDYLTQSYNEEQLAKELKNPESFFYFMQQGEEILGYLKLNVGKAQSEDIQKNSLEVERIYIRSKHKRKGYGTAGLKKAETVAKEMHKSSLWLGVWEFNAKARAFYETQGFKEVGAHSFFMGEEEQTDLILLKML